MARSRGPWDTGPALSDNGVKLLPCFSSCRRKVICLKEVDFSTELTSPNRLSHTGAFVRKKDTSHLRMKLGFQCPRSLDQALKPEGQPLNI